MHARERKRARERERENVVKDIRCRERELSHQCAAGVPIKREHYIPGGSDAAYSAAIVVAFPPCVLALLERRMSCQ